jgi:hypothetical protein
MFNLISLFHINQREKMIGFNLLFIFWKGQSIIYINAQSHTTIIRFAPYTVPTSRARGARREGPHYLAIPECSANVPWDAPHPKGIKK